MFKTARWRNERNRIKVVFKLQFQATQIPQGKWDNLVVSLIPLDVGKPTARSEKAAVHEGCCQWEKPVYETVRFVREPKAGRINEKVYHIHVSAAGSPKAAILGEATIDFVDYAESIKPCSVSLPLEASDANVLLHVTILRMQDEVNRREYEGKAQSRTLRSQLNDFDKVKDPKILEKTSINGKVQTRFPSSRAIVLHTESNVSLQKSSSFDAISITGSDISPLRRTPRGDIHENGNIHSNSTSLLSPLSNNHNLQSQMIDAADSPANCENHQRSNTEWSASSAPDGSVDGSMNSFDDAVREKVGYPDDSVDKLRNDIVVLGRQVEVSELELQALRKQVVKERKQVEGISRDLRKMRVEKDALNREYEKLKASQERDGAGKLSSGQQTDGNLRSIIEEMKHELDHEKNLNANLRLQLQKTQESNSELMLAVRDMDEMLERKNMEAPCVKCVHELDKLATDDNHQSGRHGNRYTPLKSSEKPFDTQHLEKDGKQYDPELLIKEWNIKSTYSTEQKIKELHGEIDMQRKDHEELEMQMEQLALDYEILKQENHDISLRLEQTQLREQLRIQYECSAHLSIINELESQVESLEKELEKQALAFEADLASLSYAKVEQEKRAIRLEEALRNTRWRSVTTAEHLKLELEHLSTQMLSALGKNEKLSMQALAESSKLHVRNGELEEMLKKASLELVSQQDYLKMQFEELSTELDSRRRQIEELNMKLNEKGEELENQKKSEAEKILTFSEEILKISSCKELLEREKSNILEQLKRQVDAESHVDQLKAAMAESEFVLQTRCMEIEMLRKECSSVRQSTRELNDKLDELRLLNEEKQSIISALTLELAVLKAERNGLDSSLVDKVEEEETGVVHHEVYSQEEDYSDPIIKKNVMEGDTITTFLGNDAKANSTNTDNCLEFICSSKEVCNFVNKKSSDMMHGIIGFLANEENHEVLQEPNSRKKTTDMAQLLNYSKKVCSSDVEEALTGFIHDQTGVAEMLSELTILRETKKSMEDELKEMQERYSEISLKFAEVEGERQQLVMKVRTLKNALKN